MNDLTQHDAAQLVAAMEKLGDELAATRQYFLSETATTGRQLSERVEHVATTSDHRNVLLRDIADDVTHIRGIVDKLDGLVGEAVAKLHQIKLPKFLQGMVQ